MRIGCGREGNQRLRTLQLGAPDYLCMLHEGQADCVCGKGNWGML